MDRLLVSFLNTALDDALESPLTAARWWASVQHRLEPLPAHIDAKPRFNPRLLAEMKILRNALGEASRRNAVSVRFTGNPPTDTVLFPLTYAAASFFSSERAKRLKTCTHPPCSRYFLDETKNGSRRWCSLRCMERARAPRRRTISR
jgi:predicted RNA-binding Zn ribbon-like protein